MNSKTKKTINIIGIIISTNGILQTSDSELKHGVVLPRTATADTPASARAAQANNRELEIYVPVLLILNLV